MPRYFFHVEDGVSHADAEGLELRGIEAAREHAVSYFAELLRDAPHNFWKDEDWVMRVTDETGLIFFTLHFTATVAAAGARPVHRT